MIPILLIDQYRSKNYVRAQQVQAIAHNFMILRVDKIFFSYIYFTFSSLQNHTICTNLSCVQFLMQSFWSQTSEIRVLNFLIFPMTFNSSVVYDLYFHFHPFVVGPGDCLHGLKEKTNDFISILLFIIPQKWCDSIQTPSEVFDACELKHARYNQRKVCALHAHTCMHGWKWWTGWVSQPHQ